MIGHITFHLGQISAWRRVAGMGPASTERFLFSDSHNLPISNQRRNLLTVCQP